MQEGRQCWRVLSAGNTCLTPTDNLIVAFELMRIIVRIITLGCVLQTGKDLQHYVCLFVCDATAVTRSTHLRS